MFQIHWYPIHFAAAVSDFNILATLLHFSNPNEEVRRVCHDLSTALHIAVTQGNVESVMILLKHGADVSTQNQEGNTALHLCCRFNNMDIARALLAAGATVGVANGKGHTPIYIAKHYKNNDLCKFLSGVQKKEIPRGSIDELLKTERYASLQPHFPEIAEKVTPVSVPLEEKKEEEPIAEPALEPTVDEPVEAPAEGSSEITQELWTTIHALSERISRLTEGAHDSAEMEELNEASHAVENLMKNVNVAEQEIPESQEGEEGEEESENDGPFLVPTTAACEVCGSGVCVSLCQECRHAFCHVCTSSQEHLNLHLGQYF